MPMNTTFSSCFSSFLGFSGSIGFSSAIFLSSSTLFADFRGLYFKLLLLIVFPRFINPTLYSQWLQYKSVYILDDNLMHFFLANEAALFIIRTNSYIIFTWLARVSCRMLDNVNGDSVAWKRR